MLNRTYTDIEIVNVYFCVYFIFVSCCVDCVHIAIMIRKLFGLLCSERKLKMPQLNLLSILDCCWKVSKLQEMRPSFSDFMMTASFVLPAWKSCARRCARSEVSSATPTRRRRGDASSDLSPAFDAFPLSRPARCLHISHHS